MALIDDLVHQFSDPMAFFRELVQNSIDSGTGEVEIHVEHADDQAKITVRDWGEGMSREIIETKLVRLFASGKDDDLTKIGRFGIGFVSVFAVEPDQVIVETGRSGENWRVVFSPNRTYELYRLPHPIEGTEIRLFKTMDLATFSAFQDRARETVRKWCKHAEIPVFFNGEPTAQPFDVPSLCKVTHTLQGTRIVMGFATDDEDLRAGYYNRGLTLVELDTAPWPWTSFRIDSHLLEHTLTRDQLLRDRHLERANTLLAELATTPLPEQLMDRLEELASRSGVGDREAHNLHLGYLQQYLHHQKQVPRAWQTRPIFHTTRGAAATLRDIQEALSKKTLRLTLDNSAIAEAIDAPHLLMLHGDPGLRVLLTRLFGRAPAFVESDFLLLADLHRAQVSRATALKTAVLRLLHETGQPVDDILFVDLSYHLNLELREAPFFSLPTTQDPIPRTHWMLDLGPSTTLALNFSHDLDGDSYEALAALAIREPEWAALVVVESLAIRGDINPTLLHKAQALREARLR